MSGGALWLFGAFGGIKIDLRERCLMGFGWVFGRDLDVCSLM